MLDVVGIAVLLLMATGIAAAVIPDLHGEGNGPGYLPRSPANMQDIAVVTLGHGRNRGGAGQLPCHLGC
jgi:hypothetical protein